MDSFSAYKCYECDKTFQLRTKLHQHIASEHETDNVQCKSCNFTTKHRTSLKRHYEMVHEGLKKAICEQCGFRTFDKYDLKKHLLRHEHSDLHRCYKCEFGSRTLQGLRAHMVEHVPQDQKKTLSSSTLTEVCRSLTHHKTVHGVLYYVCSVCRYQTISKPDLRTHIKLHYKIRDAVCDKCSRSFVTKSDLYRHQKNVHGVAKEYTCKTCSTTFHDYVKFRAHRRDHLEEASAQRRQQINAILKERQRLYKNKILSGSRVKRKNTNNSSGKTVVQASQNWTLQGEAQTTTSINTITTKDPEHHNVLPVSSLVSIPDGDHFFLQNSHVQIVDEHVLKPSAEDVDPQAVKTNQIMVLSSNDGGDALSICDDGDTDPTYNLFHNDKDQSAAIDQLVTYSLQKLSAAHDHVEESDEPGQVESHVETPVEEVRAPKYNRVHSGVPPINDPLLQYGNTKHGGMETMLTNIVDQGQYHHGSEHVTYQENYQGQCQGGNFQNNIQGTYHGLQQHARGELGRPLLPNVDLGYGPTYDQSTYGPSGSYDHSNYDQSPYGQSSYGQLQQSSSDEIYMPNEPRFDLLSETLKGAECFDSTMSFFNPEQVTPTSNSQVTIPPTAGGTQTLLMKHLPVAGQKKLFNDVLLKIPVHCKLATKQKLEVEVVPWK